MRSLLRYVILICLGVISAIAQARIYRHMDPATGVVIYSNVPLRGQRPKNASTPAPAPVTQANSPTPSKPTSSGRPSAATPADFPRVAAATQRERDSERHKILNEELASEQSALNDAIARKAAGEVIQRRKANIEALQREIGNVK